MKTVKEAKKSTTKVVKKTVKPVFTVKIEPNMTVDELHRAFIDARVEKKLPITEQDVDFIDTLAYNEGVYDGLTVGGLMKECATILKSVVEDGKCCECKKKTPWYKKMWHFVTFRGWK